LLEKFRSNNEKKGKFLSTAEIKLDSGIKLKKGEIGYPHQVS